MTETVGVRFRQVGKIYDFATNGLEIKRWNRVIVETARGVEYGTVLTQPVEKKENPEHPFAKIIRLATLEDEEKRIENRLKEKEAFDICKEKIENHKIGMKLVKAEYAFDRSKLLFYFTADGRVDFRELVKDLASTFHTRIELRQIGVRDETKILGGIGSCGRKLCCSSYLHDFAPVSIKMAKIQNLSLNPGKISGSCGRLMCCLRNEVEAYEFLNSTMPMKGDWCTAPDGTRGQVVSMDIFRQSVQLVVEVGDDKEMRQYPASELKFKQRSKHKDKSKDDRRGSKHRDNNRDKSEESGSEDKSTDFAETESIEDGKD